MRDKPRIHVYQYSYWDEETQGRRRSLVYATLEAIRNGLGVPLYETGIEVAVVDVQEGGIYTPRKRPAEAQPD